ncbi:MAG: DNA primase [Clostridia bacterium]|nr:DNA primase [Clostridia bacterium]
MNSLFTQIKSQVTARQAAERYGIPVSRSGLARCIFHDDRHPSMKIDERFYCFGCHATGDVIDFTAKLFSLAPYEAAKKLAADFGIRPLPPGQSAAVPKMSAAVTERKEEQRVLGLLVDYERLLQQWKEEFAPLTPDVETWDERFCQAVRHQIPVGYAIECLLSADPAERKDMMDYIRSTDTAAQIEDILKNGIPEVNNRGREKDRAA